jgi:hypothetical protein
VPSQTQVWAAVEIKNILDGSTTSWIYWNASSITLGSTSWRAADAYVVLYSTITNSNGGVQIYTDNKSNDASAVYTGAQNPVGLIAVEDTTEPPLPMCWRIVDSTTTTLTIKELIVSTTGYLYSNELGSSYHCFLWMEDRNTSGFQYGADYVTAKSGRLDNSGNSPCIQDAEGQWDHALSPDYIYFGADFTNARSPRTYRTNIRIETFTE